MTVFLPVGWENGRVAPPSGINCPNTSTLMTEIAKVMPGGSNAGGSADLILTGTLYGSFGIRGYTPSGSNKLRLYGRQDGATRVAYNTSGGNGDNLSATFRIDGSSNVEIYNIDFDGESTNGATGSNWGIILGGAYNTDPNLADVFDIVLQGCRSRNTQQIGIKCDGNGGSDGFLIKLCTTLNTGREGNFGEGIYGGDGSTGRSYSNLTITQCEISETGAGEGIEAKRNGGGTVEISYNYVHNIHMDSGGAIKTERPYDVFGNRVHTVTASGSTTAGDGIEVVGGNVHNNIVWDCSGSCITVLKSQSAGDTCTLRHNTLDATGGDRAFSFNNENYLGNNNVVIDGDHNVYVGTHFSGSLNGGSVTGHISASSSNFVGPITGTADAGDGIGSGFEIDNGSARNAVGTIITTLDIQGLTRVTSTDAGAIDADISATPTAVFAITAPVQSAIDVTTPLTVSGTAPDSGHQDYEISAVVDGNAPQWNAATFTSGTETFAGDSTIAIPQGGETIRVRARRWS